MAELNRSSPLPLYAQLAKQMELRISSGAYPTGSCIPSEHSLCDEFSVGRPTVRQATDELVRKGLIERKRGSGTFVREKNDAIDLFSLGGTIRSFEDKGVELSTRLVGPVSASVHADGRPGYQLTRLAYAKKTPLLLEAFWFDAQVFADLPSLSLQGQSLSRTVESKYGLRPLSADQTFSAELLSPAPARLLRTRPSSVALCVERRLHFSIAKDAIHVRMLCKQDANYSFFQTIGGHIA